MCNYKIIVLVNHRPVLNQLHNIVIPIYSLKKCKAQINPLLKEGYLSEVVGRVAQIPLKLHHKICKHISNYYRNPEHYLDSLHWKDIFGDIYLRTPISKRTSEMTLFTLSYCSFTMFSKLIPEIPKQCLDSKVKKQIVTYLFKLYHGLTAQLYIIQNESTKEYTYTVSLYREYGLDPNIRTRKADSYYYFDFSTYSYELTELIEITKLLPSNLQEDLIIMLSESEFDKDKWLAEELMISLNDKG